MSNRTKRRQENVTYLSTTGKNVTTTKPPTSIQEAVNEMTKVAKGRLWKVMALLDHHANKACSATGGSIMSASQQHVTDEGVADAVCYIRYIEEKGLEMMIEGM